MRDRASVRRQKGAVIITVALMMLFLLGFMAAAIDFGRLFIARSELQTALDGCALAAAQELDAADDAFTRARRAGSTTSNINRVNLQSVTWSGQGQVVDADITFFDKDYNATTIPAQATYARCAHTHPNIQLWLLQAMGAFMSDAAAYPSTANVAAQAVATVGSAQTTCPLPIALKVPASKSGPLYGFYVGQWVTVLSATKSAGSGEFGWYNIDGSKDARSTKDQLEGGVCNVSTGTLYTPGQKVSADEEWNYRFGIYKNKASAAEHAPDLSGYAYSSVNWGPGSDPAHPADSCCAYNGNKPAVAGANAANFVTQRQRNQPYGTDVAAGSTEVFGDSKALPGGYKDVANASELLQYGAYRRVVPVPVLDDVTSKVKDFLCVFMLQPLKGSTAKGKTVENADVQVEIRGNAADPNSGCTSAGLPGGVAGPRVPVLVR